MGVYVGVFIVRHVSHTHSHQIMVAIDLPLPPHKIHAIILGLF